MSLQCSSTSEVTARENIDDIKVAGTSPTILRQPSQPLANLGHTMQSSLTTCLFKLLDVATVGISQARAQLPMQPNWNALNATLGGRLSIIVPYSHSCFVQPFNSSACVALRSNYLDEGENHSTHLLIDDSRVMSLPVTRSNTPGAYIQTQWETCQATNQECLLDYLNLGDVAPTLPPFQCKQGSVPSYFVSTLVAIMYVMSLYDLQIDVQCAEDVSAAFAFVAKTNVTLAIKNTGVRLNCAILEQYLFPL